MTETFMRPVDVARLLQVSTAMVRKLHNSGQLDAFRTEGGYRIFKRSDVERLAAQRIELKPRRGQRTIAELKARQEAESKK